MNYDNIAWFYDALASTIFMGRVMDSQRFLVSHIPPGSHILIVGGGSGKVVEEIVNYHESGLYITYVEISEEMIQKARKVDIKYNNISFIHKPIEEFISNESFDIIVTPFLFDNFKADKIHAICNKLDLLLAPQGFWLQVDFVNSKKLWQRILLKIMYGFFRLVSRIEANTLYDVSLIFNSKYNTVAEKYFYADFIKSTVYKRKFQ